MNTSSGIHISGDHCVGLYRRCHHRSCCLPVASTAWLCAAGRCVHRHRV